MEATVGKEVGSSRDGVVVLGHAAAQRYTGPVVSLLYHDVWASRTAPLPGTGAEPTTDAEFVTGFMRPTAAPYKLSYETFDEHLKAIAAAGRVPTTVQRLHAGLTARRLAVTLTFDDGGVSAYSIIAPMLEARGWRGHFFIVTDAIGQTGFMSEDQVKDLHGRGHVIGSHSCSHPERMSSLTDAELRHEWRHSVGVLSDVLGERVDTASVPNGYYAPRVGQAAAEAGIRRLFTSEPTLWTTTVDRCEVLGRFHVLARTPAATVSDLVAERSLWRARQSLHWKAKKLVKAVGGTGYLALRSLALGQRSA